MSDEVRDALAALRSARHGDMDEAYGFLDDFGELVERALLEYGKPSAFDEVED